MTGYLVRGNSNDSGNLKGLLRKLGRKYEQDAVIHKGYYRDAELHALKDLPDLGPSAGESTSLDQFDPDRIGAYYTLMIKRGTPFLSLGRLGPHDADQLGRLWEEIGFWSPKSFSSRLERRVYFDQVWRQTKV